MSKYCLSPASAVTAKPDDEYTRFIDWETTRGSKQFMETPKISIPIRLIIVKAEASESITYYL